MSVGKRCEVIWVGYIEMDSMTLIPSYPKTIFQQKFWLVGSSIAGHPSMHVDVCI